MLENNKEEFFENAYKHLDEVKTRFFDDFKIKIEPRVTTLRESQKQSHELFGKIDHSLQFKTKEITNKLTEKDKNLNYLTKKLQRKK